ncbi:hypothetical protein C0Q70_01877 [Pomacea canaliculata]|uniref:Band 7 domain-containing protein n=1 Tax=Pomacea canaliculata TaxID=400727 RepID=A0A2T7Q0Q7_POMCA|nr:prohibitin-2-like [Pomacea canaliculata]PVD39249.1 hypothetical protein C0Q70_01877 [Pomacea canaliculata]
MPTASRTVCIIVIAVLAALVIMSICLIATSLKKLKSAEVGLKYNTIWKNLDNKVYTEGLHAGPPGFTFIIFPNTYTTLTYSKLRCLNKDGVPIRLDITFQFKAKQSQIYDIIMDFRDFDGYKQVLTNSGQAVVHEACSHYNTSQFQSERGNFQSTLSRILRERFDKLSADITDLQVNNIERPSEYEAAIRSKERAREDIEVAKNERPRLLTEANTKKREAESEAQIILDKAESDARIMQNKAKAEAEAILTQYRTEAEAYTNVISANGLNFSPEGFISYLGVRVIASAKNPVYIGLESPAKTSYKTP